MSTPAPLASPSLRSRLADAVPARWWRQRTVMPGPDPWPACIVAFHRVWDQTRDELSVPQQLFRRLCRHWKQTCTVVSLEAILEHCERPSVTARPLLAITFDDGYADNAEIAAPILADLRLPATFFITSHFIGMQPRFPWDAGIHPAPRMMTWRQVRELARAGFSIGSHTCHHVRLSQCEPRQRMLELVQSRDLIEQKLGQEVQDFAYPFGGITDCRPEDVLAVRQAGYRCCLSCHGGLVYPRISTFRLNRICVSPVYHRSPSAWERQYGRALREAVPGALVRATAPDASDDINCAMKENT